MPDQRPLLLFFASARSGPSRRMESLLACIGRRERHRLRLVQVDVDERADLAERLAVEEAPTLVLVKDKRAVARIEGRASAPRIDELLEQHLDDAASA